VRCGRRSTALTDAKRFVHKLREARERSGKTHECLAIRVARKLKAINVIDILSDLFILRGIPGHIRFDNGPEFVAEAVQKWIAAVGAKTAYIERGRPFQSMSVVTPIAT
jgi:hypothetical protein